MEVEEEQTTKQSSRAESRGADWKTQVSCYKEQFYTSNLITTKLAILKKIRLKTEPIFLKANVIFINHI